MFEKFTDRARRVMQLANQEALLFNHEHLGTEHILLGLVKEGSGVAHHVLTTLGVDLHTIRTETEKAVQPGPPKVVMGRLPHTQRAKKVIEAAIEEARAIGDSHVGTEHMLLGLLREPDGVAADVLRNLNVNVNDTRYAILNLVATDRPPELSLKGVVIDGSHRLTAATTIAPDRLAFNPYLPKIELDGHTFNTLGSIVNYGWIVYLAHLARKGDPIAADFLTRFKLEVYSDQGQYWPIVADEPEDRE